MRIWFRLGDFSDPRQELIWKYEIFVYLSDSFFQMVKSEELEKRHFFSLSEL